jgi:hypothetical protein
VQAHRFGAETNGLADGAAVGEALLFKKFFEVGFGHGFLWLVRCEDLISIEKSVVQVN